MFAGGRCPRRPFLLAANRGNAAPGLPLFADGDAVADRLALRQDVIEKLIAGIDDDSAGGFLARVLDDVTPVLLRNGRLRLRQIGHQLPVAGAPAGLSRGRKRCLHAATKHQRARDYQRFQNRAPWSPIFETEYRLIISYRCYLPSDLTPRAIFLANFG